MSGDAAQIAYPLVVAPLGLGSRAALGWLAPVERGPMSALAGKAQKWQGRLLMPLFHPSPRVTNTRRSLELQVNDIVALRALVDCHVEQKLGPIDAKFGPNGLWNKPPAPG